MNRKFLAIATTAASCLFADKPDEFVINLKDPQFTEGVIKTDQGGVITASGMRIQAQKIEYINTKKTQKIVAEGDLFLEYEGKYFVGDRLEFNVRTKTGHLSHGVAFVQAWYVGGDSIELCPDGSFIIRGAFATTAVSKTNPWSIESKEAYVSDEKILKAEDVTFQVLGLPMLYLPFFRSDLNKFQKSPLKYRFLYDKGVGPRISVRYRFYSTETFKAYARLDYRYNIKEHRNDPGGALEAEYNSKDKRTQFQTRNYGAAGKIFPNENGNLRYRFQGLYKTKSEDEYSRFHMQWDRLSDDRMVSDFRDPDFEINTQKATYLEASHYEKSTFGNLSVRPRINPFQSLNQELPYGVLGIRPFDFGSTGFIMENYASGSYLDYTFATKLDDFLRDRRSGRLETMNSLYRPISISGFNVTPRAGIVGIYYSNSPDKEAAGQFLFTYGGEANTRFYRDFAKCKHMVEPYAKYLGYSKPKVRVGDYFVFDIHDGYDKVDQLRFGLRQNFFTNNNIFLPYFTLDLYSYAFWGANSFDQTIPKAFVDFKLNERSTSIRGWGGWNIQEHVLDYGNIEFLWTVNESVALGVEFRHRSKFWWRKADYDNYVVDFARPLNELLASPLSDQRNTLLTKAHFRLSPRWNLHLQTHHGWGRPGEPRYNGAKIDLFTMVTGSWQAKLSYEYLENVPYRFSYSFKLIK